MDPEQAVIIQDTAVETLFISTYLFKDIFLIEKNRFIKYRTRFKLRVTTNLLLYLRFFLWYFCERNSSSWTWIGNFLSFCSVPYGTVPFRAEVSDPRNGKTLLIYITFLFTLINEIRNVRIGRSYVGYALVLRSLMCMASFVTVISRR